MFPILNPSKQDLERLKIQLWPKTKLNKTSNYVELNKITLVGCMDKVLNQSLTKQNIKSRFRATCIYGLYNQRQWTIGFNLQPFTQQ
jgi:hypothetical protein